MSKSQHGKETALAEAEIRPVEFAKGQEDAYARDIARLQKSLDRFIAIDCPACCKPTQHSFYFEKFRFEFQRCHECGTIYMSPRPTEEVLAAYYHDSENYRYWATHIFPASENSRREKICKPRLAHLLDVVERCETSRRCFMEVGPGFGTFAALVQQSGAFERVAVVEPTPELAQECRKRGLQVLESRIEDAPAEESSVDVLGAFEVIEHIFEPRRFLETAFRLVRPGGLVMLTCPNGEGFDIAELGTKSGSVDMEHVNLFNTRSLAHLGQLAGFSTVEVSTPGRLDAELVRSAARAGHVDIRDPFLRRVLLDEWDRLGAPFQSFLAEHGLSSHLCYVGQRPAR